MQEGFEFDYNTGKTELEEQIVPALDILKGLVNEVEMVMKEANEKLEECEQYDDTEGQLEWFKKAKETYEAIVKLYEDVLEA